MDLLDSEVARIRRLLWEIKRETHGKSRGIFIDNTVDKISLLLRKAERRHKKVSK